MSALQRHKVERTLEGNANWADQTRHSASAIVMLAMSPAPSSLARKPRSPTRLPQFPFRTTSRGAAGDREEVAGGRHTSRPWSRLKVVGSATTTDWLQTLFVHLWSIDLDAVESTVNEHDTDIAIVPPKRKQNPDDEKGGDDNSGPFTANDVWSKCRSANRSLQRYSGKITYHITSVTSPAHSVI